MGLIDFHCHAFPDPVAPGAIEALTRVVGPINVTDGTLADTIRFQRELGSDHFLLYNIPTRPHQMRPCNDFVLSWDRGDNGRIISFGSIHPAAADAMDELRRLIAAGIRGIKFHPEYQDFNMDDRAVYPLYEAIAQAGLVMTFHGGMDPAFPGRDRSSPRRAASMVRDFPGAKIVVAHMGDSRDGAQTLRFLCGLDCYLDTSMAAKYQPREQFQAIVEAHGPGRILHATDCPWSGFESREAIEALPLSREEKEGILWKNAASLLGLPCQ